MDELLEIILRDKTWNKEVARKTFIAILELLTPPKPKATPEAGKAAGGIELTQSWRPRPAMYDETCWQRIAFAGK
jgi:hypothetical protein